MLAKHLSVIMALAFVLTGTAIAQGQAASISPVAPNGLAESTDGDQPCQLNLRHPGDLRFRGIHSRGYNARDGGMHSEISRSEVHHTGDACTYILDIKSNSSTQQPRLRGPGGNLSYHIEPMGNVAGVKNAGSIRYKGNLRDREPMQMTGFSIAIPPGQDVSAGRYEDRVDLVLFRENDGRLEIASSRTMRVFVDVPARVTASIGGNASSGGSSTNVDFGTLQTGEKRSVGFSTYANTQYSMHLRSDEGGGLRHDKSSLSIPYTVQVWGQNISSERLAQGADLSGSGSGEQSHSLDITIGNVGGAAAGTYRDRLTLVITAD